MVRGESDAPESMTSAAGGLMRNVRLSGAVDWLKALFANIAASPTAAHPSVRFVLFVERGVCYTGNWGGRKTMRRGGVSPFGFPNGDFYGARATQETAAMRRQRISPRAWRMS